MGIRVLHCDDSEAFTRLVAFWLAEHDDIEYVGEARTAEAALAALPTARPDVVLLDTLGRPGDDTVLQAIRRAATLSLDEVLDQDFRVGNRFLRHPDLREGIRARIIDKDRQPRWNPATLDEVTDAEVAGFFEPLNA